MINEPRSYPIYQQMSTCPANRFGVKGWLYKRLIMAVVAE
jgi:hypothetical protein